MSQEKAVTIGLGVRDPEKRSGYAIRTYGVLLEEIHRLGANTALVGYTPDHDELGLQQLALGIGPDGALEVTDKEASVDAIRDLTGKFSSLGVPNLNEPEIRAVTTDKAKLSEILGGDTFDTHVLEPGADLKSLLLNMDGGLFIVKPMKGGLASEGVEIISSPRDAQKVYEQQMIVQPYADTTHMSDQIKGIGEFYQALTTLEGMPKELRMYAYRLDDATLVRAAIVRVSRHPEMLKKDYSAIIEQETVPQEAHDLLKRTLDALATHTGIPHISAAVDMPWIDGAFKVMEVNTKQLGMPDIVKGYDGEDQLGASARKDMGMYTRRLAAGQLVDLASKA